MWKLPFVGIVTLHKSEVFQIVHRRDPLGIVLVF